MTSSINEHDLFSNPMIEAAKKNMTLAELNRYKVLGEEMFAVDYENILECENSLENFKIQIENCVKSGLHISYLTPDEKKFMFDYVGPTWFENYGFTALDLVGLHSNF
jgi:hypothetical protein